MGDDDRTVELAGETISKRPHLSVLKALLFGDSRETGWDDE